jgi:AcrR family transcriptional regulator
MPPKVEITKEKVINAAFEIIRERGFEGLSARNIAQKLKCSTQPIYSLFISMEELKKLTYQEAVDYALSCMTNYQKLDDNPALNLVYGYLHFAKEEKELYRSLYLSGYKTYTLHREPFIGEKVSMEILRKSDELLTDVSDDLLRKLYLRAAVHLLGLGALINTNTIDLEIDEAAGMILELYKDFLVSEGLTKRK